jgi:hypothetical protein
LPDGLVNASVAVKASSMAPWSASTSTSSNPRVAAAGGIGARPSTPSQNGPDLAPIAPPAAVAWEPAVARLGAGGGGVLNGIDLTRLLLVHLTALH